MFFNISNLLTISFANKKSKISPLTQNKSRKKDKNINNKNKKNNSYITIKNISAAYKNNPPVLKDINLKLPKSKITTIIGPNGAGKSTLFYLLLGLKKPLKGKITVFGKSINYQRKKNNIAYVPQEEEIDWDYPIRVWNVVMTGRYGHMKSVSGWRRYLPPIWTDKQHKKEAEEALKAVEMYSYRNNPLGELSGGQKKRVFLARALAQQAQLLLLDEPFIGIDPYSEKLITGILKKLKSQEKTIIMITHDLNKVNEIADLSVLLDQKVISSDNPENLLSLDKTNPLFQSLNLSQLTEDKL